MEDKYNLTETEIRTRYITPALVSAGWKLENIREEYSFTDGRIIDEGKGKYHRGERLRTDYLLTFNNKFIAVVEAKDNKHNIEFGMQQAINYANILDCPFAFSSNGDGFQKKNMLTGEEIKIELDDFPSPEEMWKEYLNYENLNEEQERIITEDFYPAKYPPRYYQQIAIERTLKAIAKDQNRIILVMATGTGKTYTAFQIIYRLWKSGSKKRILYLADRNILIDQTMVNDFAPFSDIMTKINGEYDPAYQIYMALYQQLKGTENRENLYEKFPKDFFDLIVIDECHRGSASEDSSWREILNYFSSATQIGLTATPKNKDNVSNFEYFGKPIYTYSLKQGIADGFLAPYKVIRIGLDKDISGVVAEGETYGGTDINKRIVLPQRDKLVAKIVSNYLKETNRRNDKAIFFCVDVDHADRLRTELINENLDMVEKDDRYVMRITGDDEIGKNQIDNFINPRKKYPTLVTTSKLLTTGVDAKTCKLIVIDTYINSMVEFKQIIGRGTRISEDFNKYSFIIIDFTGATELFKDPQFDGEADDVFIVTEDMFNGNKENKGNHPRIKIKSTDIIEDKPKKEKRTKLVLPNERVVELYRQEKLIDEHGNLYTESFNQFVKNKITDQFETVNLFKDYWNNQEIKEDIIHTLEEKDIYIDILSEELGEEYDAFDLLVHTAYGEKLLTRSQRARKVRRDPYFEKYSQDIQDIIQIILDKYVETGIDAIENPDTLKVSEFKKYGTMTEIITTIFSGVILYKKIMQELKERIYK